MAGFEQTIETLRQYDIIGAAIIIIAAFVLGEIVKLIIRHIVKKITKKTRTSLDDELLNALEKPILWGITTAGIFIALFSLSILDAFTGKIILLARLTGIIFGCWVAVRVIGALFQWYKDEISIRTKTDMDDKYLHVFRRIINVILYAIVGMMILKQMGIEITPLIAGLGIGGLAIALALQDTLANFFSGFYMISDRAVKIGDYVEIEAPSEPVKGHVEDIGWRTSKIKTLANNYVIVPNSTFANSTVVNFQAPSPEMSVIIPVGVAYDSDLELVEKVTNEVITDVQNTVDGGKKGHEPLVRFKQFADSSINLVAIIRIKDPAKLGLVRHEFIKKLKKRYDKEGIEIPFPIRTVLMKKE